MRIAIPVVGGKLSPHFGHCEEFDLIDIDQEKKTVVRSDTVKAPNHQPGLLPRWLHEHGADLIIAAGMGMRAQQLFSNHEIEVIAGAQGDDTDEIIQAYLEGKLQVDKNFCDH